MENLQPLDQLLKKQKDAFEEVIYYLTEPGVTPGQRAQRLGQIKNRTNAILSELVTEKRRRSNPAELSMIDSFIKECTTKYKEEMERATDAMIGAEAAPDFGVARGVERPITNQATNVFAKAGQPQQQAPVLPMDQPIGFITQTTNEYNFNKKATALNISTSIDIVDGEVISNPVPTEMFYVLNPYTKDNSIQVIRFVNSAAATEYVFNNFRNDDIKPIIFFGKIAQVQLSVNLVV